MKIIPRTFEFFLLFCFLFLPFMGCGWQLMYGTGLKNGIPGDNAIYKIAWISKIKLPESFNGSSYWKFENLNALEENKKEYLEYKDILEEALTLSVRKYIRQGNYFKEVNFFQGNLGELGEDDLILNFQFDKYVEETVPHPVSVPFLIIFPLYPIYGYFGPLAIRNSDLSGNLSVEDKQGNLIVRVHSEVKNSNTLYFWSKKDKILDSRTFIIKDLLDKAVIAINKSLNPNG